MRKLGWLKSTANQGKSTDAQKYLEAVANSNDINIKNFASLELMKIFAEKKKFFES